MAEAASFGGGAGCDAANLRLYYYIYKDHLQVEQKILELEKKFWQFINDHKHLYEEFRTYADVGIVFHDLPLKAPNYSRDEFVDLTDLAKSLVSRGLIWDVLTENRCENTTFSQLHVLIYQDVSRISNKEAEMVQSYLEHGGLVISSATVGDVDEFFRMRLPNASRPWPPVGLPPQPTMPGGFDIDNRKCPSSFEANVGTGKLIYKHKPLTTDEVITAIENHLGRTVQLITGGVSSEDLARLRLNAWIKKEGDNSQIVLHIVNYNVPIGLEISDRVKFLDNIEVAVPIPSDMKVHLVYIFSPESPTTYEGSVQFSLDANGLLRFRIPRMRIYSIAVIR